MSTHSKQIEFEFNYADLRLTPYTGSVENSTQLLKRIISHLNSSEFPKDKKILDRNKNQAGTISRELVMISNRFSERGVRCFGKIALIKNKAPMLWREGEDVVVSINRPENQKFIEVTHYLIHFDPNGTPIIAVEFNNEGPRLSDIQYYLRQIGKESGIAKFIQSSLHLKIEYDQLDKQMRNIFSVVVKVKSVFSNRLQWLKMLKDINDETGYKDIRIELGFKRKRGVNGNYEHNTLGTDFARSLIHWLKNKDTNIDYIDDLKMTYQNDDDEVLSLDFLKNKEVSIIKLQSGYDPKDLREAVEEEFSHYLTTGRTNTTEK